MNRRHALRLLLSLPIAATLDVEKLLWIPGQMIVVPSTNWDKVIKYHKGMQYLSMSEIVALEMERVLPNIRNLFERDDVFYTTITK